METEAATATRAGVTGLDLATVGREVGAEADAVAVAGEAATGETEAAAAVPADLVACPETGEVPVAQADSAAPEVVTAVEAEDSRVSSCDPELQ